MMETEVFLCHFLPIFFLQFLWIIYLSDFLHGVGPYDNNIHCEDGSLPAQECLTLYLFLVFIFHYIYVCVYIYMYSQILIEPVCCCFSHHQSLINLSHLLLLWAESGAAQSFMGSCLCIPCAGSFCCKLLPVVV